MAIVPRDGVRGKVCKACLEWKPLNRFKPHYKTKDGYEHKCLDCRAPDSRTLRKRSKRNGVLGQTCNHCGEWKPLGEYGQNDYAKDGIDYRCKECNAARSREYYEQDPATWNERNKASYQRHRKKRLKAVRRYRRDNLRAIRAYDRRRNRERYRRNPGKRLVYSHRRRARERNAEGSYTTEEWQELCKKYDHTCLCCERSEPDIQLTPDHVIPLSKGGSNRIANIQPLCLKCNLIKATKSTDYRKE